MSDQDKTANSGVDGSVRPERKKRKWHDTDEWWEERTLPEKIVVGIGFGILGIGLAFLFGLVVQALWNWLMPEIFGLKQLTYWQAWGLLILSCILLKSWNTGESSGRRSDRKRRRKLRRYMSEKQPVGEDRSSAADAPTSAGGETPPGTPPDSVQA
jgi:hypothetical protein